MARLLYQKYGMHSVHGSQPLRPNSSRLWKTLWPHFLNLQHMSRWRVGNGNIPFWQTNWMGEVLNATSDSSMTVCNGLQNMSSLHHLLT